MPTHTSTPRTLLLAVGMISGAAIAYEILLTRLFALVHWQHMVSIAIGLALLGYGASGTFVTLTGRYLHRRFNAAFVTNALLFSVSSLVCVNLAQRFQFDPQSVAWQPQAVLQLAIAFLILAIPFFAAANCVALALSRRNGSIPVVYGADLLGAGLGAVALTASLALLAPIDALIAIAAIGAISALSVAVGAGWSGRTVALIAATLPLFLLISDPTVIEPAPYKDLSRSRAISGAEPVFEKSGVTSTVHVIDNHQVRFREAPGLSLNSMAALPHQLAVFVDGDAVGAIDQRHSGQVGTSYLNDLLSSLPYRLVQSPTVAQLNVGLGRGVAQAMQLGAARVVAIESNPQLVELVCSTFASADPSRCVDARVTWQTGTARAFATATTDEFDLIHLHASNDNAGLDAINIDFDLTVEAFEQYLSRLKSDGLLLAEGPTRLPPRQSIRLFATAVRTLQSRAVEAPGAHLALLRGWQRYLLIVSAAPLSDRQVAILRAGAMEQGFDLAWLPQLQIEETNQHQQLASPYFYLAARAVLDATQEDLASSGSSSFRPAADDRPFPHRYSSWRSIATALTAETPDRLAGEDAALLVSGLILLLAFLISVLLILTPIGVLLTRAQGGRRLRGRGLGRRVAVYFGLVGLAFLAVEIGWIQALSLFLDHPLYATAIVLSGFLVFAGLGSLWAQGFAIEDSRRLLLGAVIAIIAGGSIYLLWLGDLLAQLAALPFAIRMVVSIALLAPLAFAMGVPFPVGLRYFGTHDQTLVPWAWGINGCASVISAVGAPLLALTIGFSGLIGFALLAYLVLPLLVDRLIPQT